MATGAAARKHALSFPETEERETWGHPTFRVKDKMFMGMDAEGTQVTVKASKEEQAALVGSDPKTFGVADYVGRYGWVTVQLKRVKADELRELIEESWRAIAPKRLVKAYDETA